MSSANLNTNGTLRCGQLVLGGQIVVPGDITTTVLTGQSGAGASGAVAVSSTVTNTTGATVPLAFASTGSTLVLTGNISSAGTGGGIPTLTTTPTTAGTGAVSTAFTVGTITNTTAANSLAFTGSAGQMSLGGNISSAGSVAGVASLTCAGITGGVATGAITLVGAGGITMSGTGGAGGTLTITGGGAQSVPYVVAAGVKSWTTTGTTDAVSFNALPAGTYACQVSWNMPGAPPGLLTAPVPTAGGTGLSVVCGSSVTATSAYSYSVIRLTTT